MTGPTHRGAIGDTAINRFINIDGAMIDTFVDFNCWCLSWMAPLRRPGPTKTFQYALPISTAA
jgi:hypothetical protein